MPDQTPQTAADAKLFAERDDCQECSAMTRRGVIIAGCEIRFQLKR